jgi:exopolysaccharide production protein ExoQ
MAARLLPLSQQLELEGTPKVWIGSRETLRDPLGWLACFVSFTMLLLISQSTVRPGEWTTTIVVLLFLAPWGWIVLRQPEEAFRAIIANWPLVLLPLLAMVSALWSDYAVISLRGGLQYLVTIFIGIWAGYCVGRRTVVAALLSALALVAVLSVLDGHSDYDAYTGEHVLVGLFGSKNYFAVCVSFLLLIAVAVAFDRAQTITFRILGIGSAILAIPLLIYARSVGALITSLFAVIIFLMLRLVIRLPTLSRLALLALGFLLTFIVVLMATFDVNYASALELLGKDVTLTGRTLLWQYAYSAISNSPTLGGGYEAYWQPGNWSAIQLWVYSYITDRYGYHFHNTFLEIGVDLGLVGLTVFVGTLLAIMVRSIMILSFGRPNSEQLLAITLFVFLLLRTPIEVDLFFQFQLPSILFCLIWVYLSSEPVRRLRRASLDGLVKA